MTNIQNKKIIPGRPCGRYCEVCDCDEFNEFEAFKGVAMKEIEDQYNIDKLDPDCPKDYLDLVKNNIDEWNRKYQ